MPNIDGGWMERGGGYRERKGGGMGIIHSLWKVGMGGGGLKNSLMCDTFLKKHQGIKLAS